MGNTASLVCTNNARSRLHDHQTTTTSVTPTRATRHKQRTWRLVDAYQPRRRTQWRQSMSPLIVSKPCWRPLSSTLTEQTGQASVLDLFTDDVQIYFPKFGIATGKAAFGDLATGLLGSLKSIAHYISDFKYVVGSDSVVVEGTTHGADAQGSEWSGGETPGGRFCSVFEFRGPLIARMHIYLDPDYTSRDDKRFLWGHDRRW